MRWSVVAVVCIVLLSGCGSILDGGGSSSPTPETPGNGTATPTETESPVGNISSSAPDRPMDASEAGLPVEPRGTPVDHLDLFVRSMEAYGQDVRSARVVDDGTTVRYRFRRGENVGAELEDVAVTFAVLVGGYEWDVDRLAGTIEGADGDPIATFAIDADVAEGTYYGEYTQREYYEHVQESIERLETDEETATSTPQAGAGPAPTPTETDSQGSSDPATDTPSSTPEDTATTETTPDPGSTTTATETESETPTDTTPTESSSTPSETSTSNETQPPGGTETPNDSQTPDDDDSQTPDDDDSQTPDDDDDGSEGANDTPDNGTSDNDTPNNDTTDNGTSNNQTTTANGNGSASMAAPGYQHFQRASAWSLLLLVPLGTFAYFRERFGSGED